MSKEKRRTRIYWRDQGGVSRAYADLRDFQDVGGRREALIAPGQNRATTDSDIAHKLLAERISQLELARRSRVLLGTQDQPNLLEFASYHLIKKAKARLVTEQWIAQTEKQLRAAIEYLGADRCLDSVSVRDIQAFTEHLRENPNARGKSRSPGTVRHYLNSLSNLYRRAASEGVVPPGFNPVAAMIDKPSAGHTEARWLEVHEAALYLEAARVYQPAADALPFMYPLIATFLLSGGRKSEVLGLEVGDISFDHGTVRFRPREGHRLKNSQSDRTIPLWPQLEEILRAYVFGSSRPAGRLLFPSPRAFEEKPVSDIRKSLNAIGELAGVPKGSISTKDFRHTYCAARLQTMDRGAPVAQYTVARELGHEGEAMVKRVYGHLGTRRHRSENLEFRVEQHLDALADRLQALQRDSVLWRKGRSAADLRSNPR